MQIEQSRPPKGWRWASLDELCPEKVRTLNAGRFETPFTYIDISAVDVLRKEIVGAREVAPDQAPSRARQLVQGGDVLVSGTRPNLNAVALVPKELDCAICSTGFSVLRAGRELDHEFLFSWVQSAQFVDAVTSLTRGALYPAIADAQLRLQLVPVPPLSEQRRIVVALGERHAALNDAIASTSQCLDGLDRLLDKELDTAMGSALPPAPLGECLYEVKAGVGDAWSNYRVLGATRQGLAPAKEAIGTHPQRYKLAPAGTVFYNPMRILIGPIALVDREGDEGIVSPDYVAVRPKTDRMTARYLYHWLRSEHGESAILGSARGAVRERMMFKGLSKLEMPLPPIAALMRFDQIYGEVKNLRSRLESQLTELKALKLAVLRAAFSGTL